MQYIRMPTVSAAASAPMQYLPLYCQRTVDELGKAFDIAAVGPESFEKKPAWLEQIIKTTTCPAADGGLDHATAMVRWLSELYDCHEFIARHDGAAFSVKRDEFFVAIRNLSADGLKKKLASEGVTIKTVITRQIDLFASSKSAVIADIEAAYLILHKDAAEAALIYQQSSEIVEKRMLEKYEHRLANGTATNQSVSISNLSTSAPTLEIPAGTPIAHWWLNILRQEGSEQLMLVKAVVAKAAWCVSEIMLSHVNEYGSGEHVNGLALKSSRAAETVPTPIKLKVGKVGNAKMDVHRTELANKQLRKNVMLPFWGKIICGDAALTMNKALCLPLGDNNGDGPSLYIDGSANNINRSDGCVAWMIPPLPPPRQEKKVEAAIVAEGTPIVAKKAKTVAVRAPPVATHIVDWMDLRFTVAGTDFVYQLPYVKDNPEHESVFDVKCFRKQTAWDKGEKIKKGASSVREAKTFLGS
jgi:hypothetical protein